MKCKTSSPVLCFLKKQLSRAAKNVAGVNQDIKLIMLLGNDSQVASENL